MAYAQSDRELVESDDGRIATALFEPTNVLLAETGQIRELFLGQTLLLSDPSNIFAEYCFRPSEPALLIEDASTSPPRQSL